MWLWRVNVDAVLNAVSNAGIDSFEEVRRRAKVSKDTMTKIKNGENVREAKLKQVAHVLKADWRSLHCGQMYCPSGPSRSQSASLDDIRDQVADALAAFGRFAACRTEHDPESIRCLAYLFDKKVARLTLLAVYAGTRTVDDRAKEIPPSYVSDDTEKEWYIIFRAFRDNKYVCDNVDWQAARSQGYRAPNAIWDQLHGVAAFPIRPRDRKAEPIGVVCVDSARTVEENRWAGCLVLERTLECLAKIVYLMVADTDFRKRTKRNARRRR